MIESDTQKWVICSRSGDFHGLMSICYDTFNLLWKNSSVCNEVDILTNVCLDLERYQYIMKVEAIGFSGAVILPAFKKLGELARDIDKFFHQADKL